VHMETAFVRNSSADNASAHRNARVMPKNTHQRWLATAEEEEAEAVSSTGAGLLQRPPDCFLRCFRVCVEVDDEARTDSIWCI
jgi:hypothetical protein